jgi:hypothetical protein
MHRVSRQRNATGSTGLQDQRSRPPGIPALDAQQTGAVVRLLAGFIEEQRQIFIGRSHPLDSLRLRSLQPFFDPQLLKSTRFVVAPGLENPAFYSHLQQLGFASLPQFSTMSACTFVDVLVSQIPINDALLFHELVHATQYRRLGVARFAKGYVDGFLATGDYYQIELEKQAYELEERFTRNRDEPFSVAEEVDRAARRRRF